MRRIFSSALLLLVLASVPASARPVDSRDGRDGFLDRLVRIVKTVILKIQPTDDAVRPPLP